MKIDIPVSSIVSDIYAHGAIAHNAAAANVLGDDMHAALSRIVRQALPLIALQLGAALRSISNLDADIVSLDLTDSVSADRADTLRVHIVNALIFETLAIVAAAAGRASKSDAYTALCRRETSTLASISAAGNYSLADLAAFRRPHF